MTPRHLRRLIRRYEACGPSGLCDLRQHKASPRRIPNEVKGQCLAYIREYLYDYGPTLAAEKLNEYFGLVVSKETVRQWMIEAKLWRPKQKKIPMPHPLRPRRPFLGELIQVDGSHHHWFEDRGPKACLLVFIDDATGRLMNLRFAPGETTVDYMHALKEYTQTHGVPRAMYFDKHNVFHINQKATRAKDGITQFGRVLKELDIEPIYAHSPQAKGRVERANETLQDRLVKELRFFGINTIEKANEHLKGYIERFNQQFAKLPEAPIDLHRPLSDEETRNIDFHFAIQTTKTVSKDLLVKHNRYIYKLQPPGNKANQLIKQKVILCESVDKTEIYFNQKPIQFDIVFKPKTIAPTLNRKNVDQYLDIMTKVNKYWTITN